MARKKRQQQVVFLHPVLDALIACVAIVVLLLAAGMILLTPFIFFAMSNNSPYRRCMARDGARFIDAYLCLLHV
jgi:hypothetical protein